MVRSHLALLALMPATAIASVAVQFGRFNWTLNRPQPDPQEAAFKTPRAAANFSLGNGDTLEVSTASWSWSNTTDPAGANDTVTSGSLIRLLNTGRPFTANGTESRVCIGHITLRSNEPFKARGRESNGCDFLGNEECLEGLRRMGACPSGAVLTPLPEACEFYNSIGRAIYSDGLTYAAAGIQLAIDPALKADNISAVTDIDKENWPILITREYTTGGVNTSFHDLACVRASEYEEPGPTTTASSGTTQPTSSSVSSSYAGPTAPVAAWGSSVGAAAVAAVFAAL
jgi:hypothetical protein